jgi:hypothetical protein
MPACPGNRLLHSKWLSCSESQKKATAPCLVYRWLTCAAYSKCGPLAGSNRVPLGIRWFRLSVLRLVRFTSCFQFARRRTIPYADLLEPYLLTLCEKGRTEYRQQYAQLNNRRNEMPTNRPRILIADDHTLVADLCTNLLETEFDVVGTGRRRTCNDPHGVGS